MRRTPAVSEMRESQCQPSPQQGTHSELSLPRSLPDPKLACLCSWVSLCTSFKIFENYGCSAPFVILFFR